MDNFDSVEDFVSTTFEPSFVSNLSRVSVIAEDVSEKNNVECDCSLYFGKVLFLLPSFPSNVMYACLAAIFFILSVVLNAVVIWFYRKPHTCNRFYVFCLALRDFSNVVFRLLPLLFLMLVQECKLLLSIYNFWVLTVHLGMVFEFTPGCFIIRDRFFRFYEPHLVNFFFNFKCFYLIFHALIFGLYIFSFHAEIKFSIVEDLAFFSASLTFFVWFATMLVVLEFDHRMLEKTEIESSNSQDAAETPG